MFCVLNIPWIDLNCKYKGINEQGFNLNSSWEITIHCTIKVATKNTTITDCFISKPFKASSPAQKDPFLLWLGLWKQISIVLKEVQIKSSPVVLQGGDHLVEIFWLKYICYIKYFMIVHKGRIDEFEFAYWYTATAVHTLHRQTTGLTLRTLIFTQSWSRKPRRTLAARTTNTCSLADRHGPGWTFCAHFGVWDPVNYQRLGPISCP